MVKQALISVSDKTGVVEFAKTLAQLGYRLLSTGGTAKLLAEQGLAVTEVAAYTGFPEILDGRVKTLNPRIHAGLLARRPDPAHMKSLQEHGIDPIDLLVVNLYPFEQTIAKAGCTFDDAIENIDIGGPAMLRAAAKNHESVAVVVDPGDYGCIVEELKDKGAVSAATRLALAKKVFAHTVALRRGDRELPDRARRAGQPRRVSGRAVAPVGQGPADAVRREPAPAAPRSTASAMSRRACWRATRSCRARSSRTTTSPTPTRRGTACAVSTSRPA